MVVVVVVVDDDDGDDDDDDAEIGYNLRTVLCSND